jgi:hypothetical protein
MTIIRSTRNNQACNIDQVTTKQGPWNSGKKYSGFQNLLLIERESCRATNTKGHRLILLVFERNE